MLSTRKINCFVCLSRSQSYWRNSWPCRKIAVINNNHCGAYNCTLNCCYITNFWFYAMGLFFMFVTALDRSRSIHPFSSFTDTTTLNLIKHGKSPLLVFLPALLLLLFRLDERKKKRRYVSQPSKWFFQSEIITSTVTFASAKPHWGFINCRFTWFIL